MLDSGFTITEASEMLDCTRQNIYQQKDTLVKLGYWETSETGKYYINEKGINYLREKRAETIKAKSKGFNQVERQENQTQEQRNQSSTNEDYFCQNLEPYQQKE